MAIPDSFMASPTSLAWRLPTTVRGQSLVNPSGPPRLLGTLGGMLRSFLWYLEEEVGVIIMFIPSSLVQCRLPSLLIKGVGDPQTESKVHSLPVPCDEELSGPERSSWCAGGDLVLSVRFKLLLVKVSQPRRTLPALPDHLSIETFHLEVRNRP